MKLIIQIPCFNEAEQLPQTLADLPREVDGFDAVEWLVIDDGSTDRTIEVARELGVDHLVRLTNNKGLAAGFQAGIDTALKLGADVIVNTDADNQYYGPDVAQARASRSSTAAPTWSIGDREVGDIEHFSPLKKMLQRLGSWVVRQASSTSVPDTTSGFRAYNREAAIQMMVVSKFTYTLETIIQAGKLLVAIDHVAGAHEPARRASRGCSPRWAPTCAATRSRSSASTPSTSRCGCSGASRCVIGLGAVAVWIRFAVAYVEGNGKGHVQSLILGAVLFIAAVVLWALGVIGDLLAAQRVMTQSTYERVRRIELELGVAPSHYEPAPRCRRPGRGRRVAARSATATDAAGESAGASTRARSRGGGAPVSGVTVSEDGVVTGNTYDKYGSSNPVVRRLMARLRALAATSCSAAAAPRSVLDVGCGEGVLVQRWAAAPGRRRASSASTSRRSRSRRAGPSTRRRTSSTASMSGGRPPVRRRRVRPGERDRGARARARPRAHGRRDGALRASATCSSRCRASRCGGC